MNGAEYLLFILMLSVFLGFELINKVPATYIPRSCPGQTPFRASRP